MKAATLPGTAPPPYLLRDFSITPTAGMSREEWDAHLGLYAGYVEQANHLSASVSGPTTAAGIEYRGDLSRRLAFESSGVRLHELFFEQFMPTPVSTRQEFNLSVGESFGSHDSWRKDVELLATTRGPGWVCSQLDPANGRITNYWIDLHQLSVPANTHLLFVLDCWEHAYWTDFGPKGRAKYVEAVLKQMVWPAIDRRVLAAIGPQAPL
jgi:superoxide dismutase, Fe-Mn family